MRRKPACLLLLRLCSYGVPARSMATSQASHGVPSSSPAPKHTISVFWDLDNKPPLSVPPYDAAIRLKDVALAFGRLVDMVAYANRHAFSHLPSWVKEQRRERKALDALEVSGIVVPDEPYVCGYCGRKCKTHVALKKHFKQLHERERNKRMSRLDSLKGKRKVKFKESLAERESRYKEAAKDVILPKVGYGLARELKRAGVWVRTVSDKPQAADEALKKHIWESIDVGIRCICLVSDDSDFLPVLQQARARNLHTVVVGDTPVLKRYTDIRFSWADVSTGRAFEKAHDVAHMWYGNEGFVNGYAGDMQDMKNKNFGAAPYIPVYAEDFEDWDSSDHSDGELDENLNTHGADPGWWVEDND